MTDVSPEPTELDRQDSLHPDCLVQIQRKGLPDGRTRAIHSHRSMRQGQDLVVDLPRELVQKVARVSAHTALGRAEGRYLEADAHREDRVRGRSLPSTGFRARSTGGKGSRRDTHGRLT